jgi:hypothetical protein
MSQIEIKVLKQGRQSSHVLSTCFFTMSGAYRKVDVYKQNLKSFVDKRTSLSGFETRIYTDNTGKDFVLELVKDKEDVTVLQYDCPYFREGDGHTGTFGTIVRFLPLFEKGLETVWISDIDIVDGFLNPDLVTLLKKNKCDLFIDSLICYERKPFANVDTPIVGYRFISTVTFPKQVLTHYLTKVINGDLDEFIQLLNDTNERKQPNPKFPYGMDEAFLNGPLYNNIRRHSLKALNHKSYNIPNFIVHNASNVLKKEIDLFRRYYQSPSPAVFRQVKQIYKKYLPEVIPKYPCLQEFSDKLDTFTKNFEEWKIVQF